ncbi:hypothetical protein Sjap_018069 [Stephania japonica]|uniref:Uncharacterized protein n=1 Tax=Stephania japonica TaxID=461633 RepID=A0AAP0I7B1_9MAGN
MESNSSSRSNKRKRTGEEVEAKEKAKVLKFGINSGNNNNNDNGEVLGMESNSGSSNKRKRTGEEVEAKAKVLKVGVGAATTMTMAMVCKFVGSSEQLSQHFKDNHSSERTEFSFGKPFSVRVKLYEPFVALQSSDGPVFLLNNFNIITSNSFTIVSLGNNNLEVKNLYRLTLKNGDDILTPATHALALVQSTLTVALQSRSSSATHALALALALSPATHALTFAMLLNLIDIDPFAEVVRMESNSSSSDIKRKRTVKKWRQRKRQRRACHKEAFGRCGCSHHRRLLCVMSSLGISLCALNLCLMHYSRCIEVVRMESNSSSSSNKRKRTGEEVEAKEKAKVLKGFAAWRAIVVVVIRGRGQGEEVKAKAKVLKVGVGDGNNNDNGNGATHALALVQSTLTVALQSRSSSATHALALAFALSPATHALTFAMLLNLIDIDPFAEVVRMESNSSSSSIKRKRTGEEVEAKEKAKVLKVGISSGNNNNNGDGGIPTILSDHCLAYCNGDIPLHISLIA